MCFIFIIQQKFAVNNYLALKRPSSRSSAKNIMPLFGFNGTGLKKKFSDNRVLCLKLSDMYFINRELDEKRVMEK
jgi:hypothetical protein